ncbi:hypothetical protein FBY06_1442 [Pseudomonas sp. SJZ085]|nr:hypothetical protein FBX99_1442 [Pseudomonas sp. SJZ074]TWC30015.1 hypothetical protein FBY06_1442 [Pseudomonas sp. SJZ085]
MQAYINIPTKPKTPSPVTEGGTLVCFTFHGGNQSNNATLVERYRTGRVLRRPCLCKSSKAADGCLPHHAQSGF